MTETETPRREASDPFGEWARSKDVLMSYRYLASAPHPIDRTHAENWLRLRRDLRSPAGAILAAPLAIAMLDTAGVTVDPVNILALTQVTHRRRLCRRSCRHRGSFADLHRVVILRRGRSHDIGRSGIRQLVGDLPDAGRLHLPGTRGRDHRYRRRSTALAGLHGSSAHGRSA